MFAHALNCNEKLEACTHGLAAGVQVVPVSGTI